MNRISEICGTISKVQATMLLSSQNESDIDAEKKDLKIKNK